MKTIAPAAMAAIEAGEAIVTGAVDIVPPASGTTVTGAFDAGAFDGGAFDVGTSGPATLRLWGGDGQITLGGNVYQGIGDRAIAQITSNALGGAAQGYQLGLSGVEPAALALVDGAEVKGAAIVLYRLIFDSTGKRLLDQAVFDRGRGDALQSNLTVGGTATISLAVETAARGLGRALARLRADYDQRLINTTDGYYRNAAYAAEKALYWGGKKPALTGSAVSPPIGNYGS